MKQKFILDAAPSIENATGILYAVSKMDLRGLSLSCYWPYKEVLQRNLDAINTLIPLTCSIAWGSENPVITTNHDWTPYYGERLPLPCETPVRASEEKAWDMIYRIACEEGKISIITLASLTNIAIAMFKYEDFAEHIDEIVIMGGSTDTGNVGPFSEANFTFDPYAAQVVLNSGIPLRIVGLNAARQAPLRGSSPWTEKLLPFLQSNPLLYPYGDQAVFHDLLTVMIAGQPDLAQVKQYPVSVEYKSRTCSGRLNIDIRRHTDLPANAGVVTGVATEKFQAEAQRFLKQ